MLVHRLESPDKGGQNINKTIVSHTQSDTYWYHGINYRNRITIGEDVPSADIRL